MTLNLLIVDDDTGVTDMLSILLKINGYEVTAANRGMDCMDALAKRMPDLIILDLMMPDMDGWAVCREVRRFSNVPILILSAINDPDKIASVLDAGADDYLTKPMTSSVLLARVNRLLQRTGTGKLRPTGFNNLNLSGNTRPLPS